MRWWLPGSVMTAVTAVTVAAAHTPAQSVARFVNPPTLTRPSGYSQVAVASPGRTIYTAGQVSRDASGTIVGVGDIRIQTRQAFTNLKAAIEAGGGTLRDVVKITTYVVDMSHLPVFAEVRQEFFDENPPASSVVQVVRLGSGDALIQIEGIAVVAE